MKSYYIQLKKNDSLTLKDMVSKYLKKSEEEALNLILQGSVWNHKNKTRLKNPNQVMKDELIQIFKSSRKIFECSLSTEQIIYENKNFLAVYKPAGIPVQATPESDINSLIYGVEKYLKEKKISYNPEVIHRLDTPTLGLVLFAKNKDFEKKLHNLFRNKKIKKYYLAICPKAVDSQETLIFEDVLNNGKKKQKAKSRVRVLKNTDEKRQLFLVAPETGRFHQIRKHFSAYLKPICGDRKYGSKERGPLQLICIGYRFPKELKNFPSKILYVPKEFCSKI